MLCLTLALSVLPVLKDKEVTATEKKAFLTLVMKLPHKGEWVTEKGIDKAAPHLRVLLALTEKDVKDFAKQQGVKEDDVDIYPILAVSAGLLDRKKSREYAVKHFGTIAHPEVKLFWAVGLFDRKAASPEVIKFLRSALESKEQSRILSEMLGPGFGAFKKKVKEYKAREK
jgi:hypothetical protein